MEIVLDNGFKKKEVDFKSGNIISIQSNDIKNIFENLVIDYNFDCIDNNNLFFVGNTVIDEFDIYSPDFDSLFLYAILEVLEFDDIFLKKKISNLSYVEKLYVNIIRILLLGNKRVIFNNIFSLMDNYNQKKLINLLSYLKDKDYYLVISNKNVNFLYKYADYSVVWNKKFFDFDIVDNVYNNVEPLIKNKFSVPILPLITYKAKVEKDVRLFYSKDVRDIIKDIYKHV